MGTEILAGQDSDVSTTSIYSITKIMSQDPSSTVKRHKTSRELYSYKWRILSDVREIGTTQCNPKGHVRNRINPQEHCIEGRR